jgi:hypothetical protein
MSGAGSFLCVCVLSSPSSLSLFTCFKYASNVDASCLDPYTATRMDRVDDAYARDSVSRHPSAVAGAAAAAAVAASAASAAEPIAPGGP